MQKVILLENYSLGLNNFV